jgi:hypothetical protein
MYFLCCPIGGPDGIDHQFMLKRLIHPVVMNQFSKYGIRPNAEESHQCGNDVAVRERIYIAHKTHGVGG